MTIDDVVTRTIMLVLLTAASAAISWITLRGGLATSIALVGAGLAGFVLVMVISFARITNPFVISAYAVLEGIVLGVFSRIFEHVYPGIVVQAVVGTVAVFTGMAILYKNRILRATPKFTRWVVGALIGIVAIGFINFIFAMFGANLGFVYYGPGQKAGLLAIVFSLVCVAVGALTFILDFAVVEDGIRYGLPEKYAWYASFGILVGLVFVYTEILRLLGALRQ
jgi:Predicted membrane protein